MPCKDYESDWSSDVDELKAQNDRLARIACKAMTALEDNEIEDFLLLKDDEVREWWQAHKEADRKERARLAEIERKERVRAEALARLSDEEKELLGLTKPKNSSPKKKGTWSDVIDSSGLIHLGDWGSKNLNEHDVQTLLKLMQDGLDGLNDDFL
jgi:hypothetical protein